MAKRRSQKIHLFSKSLLGPAMLGAVLKLNPRQQIKSPVMFTVYIASIMTLWVWIQAVINHAPASENLYLALVNLGLWFTLIFANFSESLAEGRGKAQAQSLRQARHDLLAKKLSSPDRTSSMEKVFASQLRKGDFVLVEAADFIPGDGEVVVGIASVNESAITGESAPVIREAGGDRSAVTGGTQVISDWIIVKITANPGETFLDKMIGLIEGAKRKKTPNELALLILLVALTLVFLLVSASLLLFSRYIAATLHLESAVGHITLVALFVCLAPTTIGGLLSAIGIAGMDRMIQANVIAMSGRAIEAAGDVDVLLLDKTGTITLGNRKAVAIFPADGIKVQNLAKAAQWASLADETPEGRSIVSLVKQKYAMLPEEMKNLQATFIPFTAETCMSGANITGQQIRKGSALAIESYIDKLGGVFPESVTQAVKKISKNGGTALVVSEGKTVLGTIELKDVVKGGIRARFARLRHMGIKTMMVTGDNPLTAAAIAAEAGVDDFLANAKPQDKLRLIQDLQKQGLMVAMTGDGTNDAPALAQADVAVAMNSGTQAAKDAGNLIDLDSNPTKLIEIVEIGKQLLMTRGALTTFSIANDIAKYFAILPAAFVGSFPELAAMNIMRLHSPQSAIVSALIFNAGIIVALIPVALRGVHYRHVGASSLLRRHLLIYGLSGLMTPFLGIKLIDWLLVGIL